MMKNRLTKRDGQGNWQLKGLPWEDINEGRIITKNRWIPVGKRLPQKNERVLATVKHSKWISDFHSQWVSENEKHHHPEESGTYLAYVNENGVWIFMDEEGCEIICEKEFGDDLGRVYDVVTHWMPLPEVYEGE